MKLTHLPLTFVLAASVALAQALPTQENPSVKDGVLSGSLKEKLDGAGYSYLKVATNSGEQWAAVPECKAKVGDTVSIAVQQLMPYFDSKALNRRFDNIYFGTLNGPAGAMAPAAQQPAAQQLPAGHPNTATKGPAVSSLPTLSGKGAAQAAPPPPMMGGSGPMGGGSKIPMAPNPPTAAAPFEGTVKEVLQVSNYTYLRLDTQEGEQWAAVPTAQVQVGAKVRIDNPSRMDGFESPTMKRRFDRLVFATLGK